MIRPSREIVHNAFHLSKCQIKLRYIYSRSKLYQIKFDCKTLATLYPLKHTAVFIRCSRNPVVNSCNPHFTPF